MKKALIAVPAALLLLIILFLMFAPKERISAVKTEWDRYQEKPDRVCLDLFSSYLSDPDSAVIDSSYIEGRKIYLSIRSRNGFNAYVAKEISCPVVDGKVDEVAARADFAIKYL